jgi:hypothetical protein
MSGGRIFLLALGAVIFAAWAWLMFRTLFLIRKRAADETGRTFPGPGATLNHWGRFLKNPEDRTLRQQLTGTTMAMFVWMVSWAALGT